MAALSERKIAIVRTLVESAPDKVVGSLRQALAETSDESALTKSNSMRMLCVRASSVPMS